MSFYDPKESIRRLRSGVAAAIKGNPSAFDDTTYPLIVVFSGEPDAGDQSRILAFMKFVGDCLPARPQIGFMRPACIRVGFNFPDADDSIGKEMLRLARTPHFEELCFELGVVQVICGGELLRFPQRDFSRNSLQEPDAPAPH